MTLLESVLLKFSCFSLKYLRKPSQADGLLQAGKLHIFETAHHIVYVMRAQRAQLIYDGFVFPLHI